MSFSSKSTCPPSALHCDPRKYRLPRFEAQHSGLFSQLLSRIVERAIAKGEPRLWTHASLMAEPAFEKLGFTLRKRERVTIGGQRFDRCEMEMRLTSGD